MFLDVMSEVIVTVLQLGIPLVTSLIAGCMESTFQISKYTKSLNTSWICYDRCTSIAVFTNGVSSLSPAKSAGPSSTEGLRTTGS